MANLYVVVTITTNVVISIVGSIGNSLLILAFLRRRQVRTISNWFNMATFMTGLVITLLNYPLQGVVDTFLINRNPECVIFMGLNIFAATAFTLNVLALTVERYISICHSLRAPTILTQGRVAVALAAIFIYAVVLGFLIPLATPLGLIGQFDPKLGCRLASVMNEKFVIVIFINFLSPIPAMLVIYCRIFIVLRRHIRAVSDLPTTQDSQQAGATAIADSRERRRWKREAKSAIFLFTLIFSFVICWMPFCIFVLQATFKRPVSPLGFSISHAIVYSTAAINPYLYGFGNKAFRYAVMSLFCQRCIKQSEHNNTNDTADTAYTITSK